MALIAIGALVLIGAVIFMLPAPATSPTSSEEVASSTIATSSEVGVSPTTTPAKSVTVSKPSTSASKPSVGTNRVTAPLGGDRWVIRENHSIQWSEESLGNGAIYLVDASTKAVVGLVTPSLTLHQKTFTWNTRDVFLTRTSGQKKDISAGQYFLRIVFEVGNKPTIESGVFSLIYPDQQITGTHSFIIKNYIATPLKITVKRGDSIYISNNDSIPYVLSMSGFSPLTVPAGQVVKFETASLGAGSYEFYSSQYSALKLGFTVQ